MPQTDTIAQLNTVLAGRYAIDREIGQGGMATIFLAHDLRHERRVALKVFRPDLAATLGPERFIREIRIAANLLHPHILPVYDSGEAGGFLYYVMPFVEGESLREKLAKQGELPIAEAVRILSDVADAMSAAHAKGVVHRDIKPENVMLSGRHAMVADFGVAKAVSVSSGGQATTSRGVALGTPTYMAPEQAAADQHTDHRADIYAFGVTAYEMLTGRPPFMGTSSQQVLASQISETPIPVGSRRASIPPALARLIMQCLEKTPADRPQSADDLLPVLESVSTPSGGTTPSATSAAGVRPWSRWKRREAWIAMVAGVAVITLIAVLAGRIARASNAGAAVPAYRQLTFNGKVTLSAISPDGKSLAYTTGWYSDTTMLFVQDLGGGPALEIAKLEDSHSLAWSADGAGVLVNGSYQRTWGLFQFPRLGGTPQRLAAYGFVAVSADGARSAAASAVSRRIDIRDLRSGATSSVRIPGSFKFVRGIAWSPRADILAVLTSPGDGNLSLWTLAVSGMDTALVVQPADGTIDSWTWARSGDAIYE